MSERQARKQRMAHQQWRVNTITAILCSVFTNPTMHDEEVAKRAKELDSMSDAQLATIAKRLYELRQQAV